MTFPVRQFNALRAIVFTLGLGLCLAASRTRAGELPPRDLAIYDRALATKTGPGETWIRFGDVGITRERLRREGGGAGRGGELGGRGCTRGGGDRRGRAFEIGRARGASGEGVCRIVGQAEAQAMRAKGGMRGRRAWNQCCGLDVVALGDEFDADGVDAGLLQPDP